MSHQYQPTSYYDWPNRHHGIFLDSGKYTYVPYEYYAGDELHNQNTVFRDSQYVTFDNTHVRFLNLSDIHIYDTSGIKIFDSGTLTLYTSADQAARTFVVDEYGRVGIGMDHNNPHLNPNEAPSFDLDVKGQVGVEDYIYHNDDVDTYMLFGSDLSAHNVNVDGSINSIYPSDQDEINFRVGGIDMIQMQTRDVSFVESGVVPVYSQDHITFNKYQFDVDHVVRSSTNTGAFVVSGDGAEVVVNEDGNADTDFRVESDHEDHMLFVDTSVNRISIGDSEDTPQATLEVTNHPDNGAFDVPLVQLNNKDTDKQALDINADNINAHVISVSATDLTVNDVMCVVNVNSLTTGGIMNLHTNSPSDGMRTLFKLRNDHVDSTGTQLIHVRNDASSNDRESVLFETTARELEPLLELRNSRLAAETNGFFDGYPARLNFNKSNNGTTPGVGLGHITFESKNTDDEKIMFASILAKTTDVQKGQEAAAIEFRLQATDSPSELRNMLSIGNQQNDSNGVTRQAEVVINEDQIDLDFRVETDITNNAFIVYGDGSEVVVNENGADTDFRVEAHGLDPTQFTKDDGSHDDTFETHYSAKKTHALYVNAENGRVGIGHDTPDTTLHVAGSAHIEGDLWVKGVTNQLDTYVHVTSAMDIHNIGTGPTLTVTQSGAQPVATFWDMDHNDTLQPALYLADKTMAGFGVEPTAPLHLSDTVQNYGQTPQYITFLVDHNYTHGGITINSTGGGHQSHLRFSEQGDWKWQLRCPRHYDGDCAKKSIRMYSREYGSDVMTWSHTGHVGIGKENGCPDTFLSVKEDFGDFDIRSFVASDLATIPFKLTDTSLNNAAFMTTAGLRFGYDGEEAPTIVGYDCGGDGQAGMAFITGSTLSDSPRLATNMVINSDGHVGIGHTAPGDRLRIHLGEDTTDPPTALRVTRDYTPVTTDSTEYKKVSYISSSKAPIASGVRDQGYRIALDASMYISDTDFKGTLDDARGIWARVGTYESPTSTDGKPTGTIKQTRAVSVNNLRAPDTTIEAQYGIYQNASLPSGADKDEVSNYFEGPLRIGGEAMNDMHAKLSIRTDKAAGTQRALEIEGPDPNIWFIDTTNGGVNYMASWNGAHGTGGKLGFSPYSTWHTAGNPDLMIDAGKGNTGLNTVNAYTKLYIESTDGLRIPVGTTDQRPKPSAFGITLTNDDPANFPAGIDQSKPMLGTIRYNTTQSTFEGFGPGNTWGSLGGVIDVDRDTYWTAVNDLSNVHEDEFDNIDADAVIEGYDDYPGDTDHLRGFTDGLKRIAITDTGALKLYRKTSGTGADWANRYKYDSYLTFTESSGVANIISSDELNLQTAAGKNVNIEGHDGSTKGLSLNDTLITSTGGEINLLDGTRTVNPVPATTVDIHTTQDTFILNDNGVTKHIKSTDVRAFCHGGLTGSRAVATDANGKLTVSATTAAELGALNGLTGSRTIVTDTNGLLTASSVTASELSVLNTASAGTVTNSKAAIYSSTGELVMTTGKVGTLGTLDASLNSVNFALSVGGNIRSDGDIVAFATSDVRLKDNIKPISQPLDKLSKITGCEFDWNAKQELYTGHDVGVIAHEVEEVLPEVVTTRDDGYKAVKYEKMIPLLIECIKDQQKQIDELKQQLNRS